MPDIEDRPDDPIDTRLYDELVAARARIVELEAAVRWALGTSEEEFRGRDEGEGMFYWRRELRTRASMPESP
jgi:hypothetical protein